MNPAFLVRDVSGDMREYGNYLLSRFGDGKCGRYRNVGNEVVCSRGFVDKVGDSLNEVRQHNEPRGECLFELTFALSMGDPPPTETRTFT